MPGGGSCLHAARCSSTGRHLALQLCSGSTAAAILSQHGKRTWPGDRHSQPTPADAANSTHPVVDHACTWQIMEYVPASCTLECQAALACWCCPPALSGGESQ